ncbi:type II toxin-antitoxin system Phd/YefM family antitoxin [Ramlibacter tataouinensis]|nr:type II toxin-antitoxin system Phd/YefM family antitoxin [Ramlibacter tataouinensis]
MEMYKMHVLPLSEFRANASAMLDLVEKGETVRIMRHGKPVADLVPVVPEPASKPSYQAPFEPVIPLPAGYSAVRGLLDERAQERW